MTDNMLYYHNYAAVPEEAQKTITGGRLNGMTDINPMWRIRCLTEAFGPCGIGWYAKITDKHIETGANDERVAIVDVELFIKVDGEWSMPIQGTGGAAFVAKERNGLYTSDEAYKMAYTDAMSVCCKLLGFGADIYWSAGRSKYSGTDGYVPKKQPEPAPQKQEAMPVQKQPEQKRPIILCEECGKPITDHGSISAETIITGSKKAYGRYLCYEHAKNAKRGAK